MPYLLTVKEVADQLRLSQTTILALCHAGTLGHFALGTGKKKRIRISQAAVDDYLRDSEGQACVNVMPPQKRRAVIVREKYPHLFGN